MCTLTQCPSLGLGAVPVWWGLMPHHSSCSLLFCTSLGQGKCRCLWPCLAAGFPAAPFLLLPEQKRDVYDRYGKDGLMGAGEWVSRATGA